MKSSCIFLLLSLTATLAVAQQIQITARILDRDDQGRAELGEYVFPEVLVVSGEVANLHIGETFRYAVWDIEAGTPPGGSGYREVPVGFILSLRATLREDRIDYGGEALSRVVEGRSDAGSSLSSKQASFYGSVEDGGIVEMRMIGGDGVVETVSLHFESVAEAE